MKQTHRIHVCLIICWIGRECLPQSIFEQQMFLKRCGRNSQSLNAIKHRSIRPEVFCKKGVLRNFAKFARKHLCQSLFFNKVAGLRPATLLKKRLWHRCFSVTGVFSVIFGSDGCFWKQSLDSSFQLGKFQEIERLVFLAYSWLK